MTRLALYINVFTSSWQLADGTCIAACSMRHIILSASHLCSSIVIFTADANGRVTVWTLYVAGEFSQNRSFEQLNPHPTYIVLH